MKRFRKIGKVLLFPHGIVLVFFVPLSTALLIYSFVFPQAQDRIRYAAYALSAYTLTAFCCKLPSIIRFWLRFKKENPYAVRYFSDVRLRVKISLYASFAYNAAYAAFQLILGIYHASVWFYSMAAYYVLLAVMRFFLLRYTRNHIPGQNRKAELHRYRFCGVTLVFMNLALSVIIFYITWQNRTFRHHEITTIAMATYTFTTFSMAMVNMIKYRRYQSPVYSAVKAISFAAAMVSMLTLETAMLTVFGQDEQENFKRLMTGLTGAFVALTVLGMAVYMIMKSTKELNQLKQNGSL